MREWKKQTENNRETNEKIEAHPRCSDWASPPTGVATSICPPHAAYKLHPIELLQRLTTRLRSKFAVILLNSFMMLLKIIMREEYMLVGVAVISSFLSMCLKF